jgi:transketolase
MGRGEEYMIRERILEISKKYGLTHVGSNLSCLPVLVEIYERKKPEDLVILDNAHAHLAHLAVMEAYKNLPNIEDRLKAFGIHCDRFAGCDASGGSLGHGLGIAIGRAVVNPNRDVYVIVSDGSTQEGSFFEALRMAYLLNLKNLKIYTNFNAYTAVAKIDLDYWENCLRAFGFPIEFRRTTNVLPEMEGLAGHYKIL